MIVRVNIIKLDGKAPSVRVSGMVKNPDGHGLARKTILYDSAGNEVSSGTSGEDGRIEFVMPNANVNNLWSVRGRGYIHEHDDVSQPLRGVPV